MQQKTSEINFKSAKQKEYIKNTIADKKDAEEKAKAEADRIAKEKAAKEAEEKAKAEAERIEKEIAAREAKQNKRILEIKHAEDKDTHFLQSGRR